MTGKFTKQIENIDGYFMEMTADINLILEKLEKNQAKKECGKQTQFQEKLNYFQDEDLRNRISPKDRRNQLPNYNEIIYYSHKERLRDYKADD